MAEKLSAKKELRQPDALQRVGSEARDWLQERQRAVGIAVIVVLLVGLAAALASYFSQRGEEQASKALGMALKPLERPVREGSAAAGTGDDAPFATQKEKDEAVVKSLEAFRSQHAGTDAAGTAGLALGQAQLRLGQYDGAITGLDDFLKHSSGGDPLRAQALEAKGYAYEGKGELDKALATYEQMTKDNKSDFLAGMGEYHRARVLIAQGKKEEAAKVLVELERDHPESAASRQARERITLLAAQGVAIPTVSPAAGADAGG